jgi:hypothetical protein
VPGVVALPWLIWMVFATGIIAEYAFDPLQLHTHYLLARRGGRSNGPFFESGRLLAWCHRSASSGGSLVVVPGGVWIPEPVPVTASTTIHPTRNNATASISPVLARISRILCFIVEKPQRAVIVPLAGARQSNGSQIRSLAPYGSHLSHYHERQHRPAHNRIRTGLTTGRWCPPNSTGAAAVAEDTALILRGRAVLAADFEISSGS